MAWTFTPQSVWLLGTNELFEVTKVLIRGVNQGKTMQWLKEKGQTMIYTTLHSN